MALLLNVIITVFDSSVLIMSMCFTFSLHSSVLERLKPEFLFSDLIALIAPDLINIFACSVAVAVSTTGWSDKAYHRNSLKWIFHISVENICDLKMDLLRFSPAWLVWLVELCFFRANRAFFYITEKTDMRVLFIFNDYLVAI